MTEAANLDAMFLVLEVVLVGDEWQDALEAVGGELCHAPATGTDQVTMMAGREQRLEALESLAEIVGADEAALDQQVERAVQGGSGDAMAAVTKPALDSFDREVLTAGEDDAGDLVALTGDGKMALA